MRDSFTSATSAFVAALLSVASATSFAQVAAPGLLARSWVIMDAANQQVLASSNADSRAEPASLTKLMTAYLVFQALHSKKISLDQIVLPSDAVRAVRSDESRMFIAPNQPVTIHDLLYGLIVQSGNDAAIALSEVVGGNQAQFVNLMNSEAQHLGMTHTHFADVNGMPDPNHYSSAGDLALLATHLINDFPEYYLIFSARSFTYDHIRQSNRNRLLWLDPSVDGLKTGHTQTAGYCLIASARRPVSGTPGTTQRIITVVMGEPTGSDRERDSLKMLDFAFHAFEEVRPYRAGQLVQTARVYKGTLLTVKTGIEGDFFATIPSDASIKVVPRITLDSPLVAPLADRQRVGTVALVVNGKVVAQTPLIALEAVPQAGFASRAWDSLLLLFGAKA
ncbi:D-alanyl-D-alanine carboxypeptidase DacC [Paraburkholderia ultramafica]|uniref:serine-type D-Ala-D-Ala carboxypeptidase n=1 Tax=Paraburkholderia ultramafica TaxID=1544867 RepID=A0A6S7CYD4_9BURK|nr:D-alanyl-D-alanine carboxypeptidase family protein [Paraburkholderia ultramafica]CAB3791194.1 D-alanyl-D-alanine carboxypeptidase DacC [Paraburkholderia ultramafica]